MDRARRSTPRSGRRLRTHGPAVVFSGTPQLAGGEAVLFDSRTSTRRLPEGETLARLVVRLAGSTPASPSIQA